MRRAGALLGTALIVGGCTGDHADTVTTAGAHPDYLRAMLDEARASGRASDAQIATLEDAAEDQSLPWADYRDAVLATLDCLERAGIPYMGPAESTEASVRVLTYAAQTGTNVEESATSTDVPPESEVIVSAAPRSGPATTPGPHDALAEECRASHSQFVEAAWAAQPSSLQAQDDFFKQRLPSILACAEDAGIDLDEDLPVRELLADVIDHGEAGRQCLRENGVTAF